MRKPANSQDFPERDVPGTHSEKARRELGTLILILCIGSACRGAPSPWATSASLSVKEEYDSSVFLQDITPLGNHDSFVTTVLPSVGIKYTASPTFTVQSSYAPEIVRFHSESGEDHVLHRATLGLGGKGRATEWDWQNSLINIEGPDESLVFSGPGGAPAAGGPRVRDRRDATIYRGGLKLTQTLGKVLLRPVVSVYEHDFRAKHLATPGYLNFVDRRDINGGVDIGTEFAPGLRSFAGYRFGTQDQARLMQYPEEYDCEYHRMLISLEGAPRKWLKLAASLGPEFRTYGNHVPATFKEKEEQNFYVDCSATFVLGSSDTVSIGMREFQQPGFAGRATYEDLTYDLSWQHKFGSRFTTALTGRAYNTDFSYPAQRDDWVLSAGLTLSWSVNSALQTEISLLYEDGESRLPNSSAHDYEREIVAVGLRYKFR